MASKVLLVFLIASIIGLIVSKISAAPHTNEVDETRIYGGHYAKDGSFPFMAVVHQLLGNGLIGQCGGTIISNRWVLTAGHCVGRYPQTFFVVFGIINKSGIEYDSLRGPGLSMIVTKAIVHPKYSVTHSDIALLKTPHIIPFSRTIQPIKLAYYDVSSTWSNQDAYVIGWGKDRFNTGSTYLKYAMLPVINNNVCKQYWRISEKHICTAPGLGRDACQGDSGGPLVVIQNQQYVQVGIVSYGDANCPSNQPGVFTRVSSFVNWINEVTDLY